jgi:hypothetical protein
MIRNNVIRLEIMDWMSILRSKHKIKGSVGLVVKVSASQPRDRGFEPLSGHDHVFLYDTSTGWFQEVESKVIYISRKNLFRKT